MRPARIAKWLTLCLLIAGVQSKLHAQGNPRVNRSDRSAELEKWQVEGVGETREDAEAEAYEKARSKVLLYFIDRKMPLDWTPRAEDIKPLVRSNIDESLPLGDGAGAARRVKLEIAMTTRDYNKFLNEDRKFRVQQRQISLSKILGGLLVLLTAVAGYFRLDEVTKGYYTGWLRLAAVSVVGIVGVGLWWIT